MNIEIIPCLDDNYSYLLYDEISNTVGIVDPSEFETCDKIIDKRHKKLDFILNTHHHYDHVGGNEKLKNKYNSTVLGFEDDKSRIPGIDKGLKDDQEFKIGTLNFTTIFIPGHTKGHIAFYFKKEKVLFTGDTLFSLGCGRVFEGTYEQMFHSLNRIKKFPGDTKIYCGHEYTYKNLEFCLKFNPNDSILKNKKDNIKLSLKNKKPTVPTTIEEEIKTNIFFRFNDPDVKKAINSENSSDIEVFTKLRDLKDNF
jgi:hydroxyacylglutathione hydrolase